MTVGSDVQTCLANIKNIEASLFMLAQQTNDNGTKKRFENASVIIGEIKEDLHKQVTMLSNEEPQYKQ